MLTALFACVEDKSCVEKRKLFEIRVTAPQSSNDEQNEKWRNATEKGRRRMNKEVVNCIYYTPSKCMMAKLILMVGFTGTTLNT